MKLFPCILLMSLESFLEVPPVKAEMCRVSYSGQGFIPLAHPHQRPSVWGYKSHISGPPRTRPYGGMKRSACSGEVLSEQGSKREPGERVERGGRLMVLSLGRKGMSGGGEEERQGLYTVIGICVYGCYLPTAPPLGRPRRETHSALHLLYSAVSCHLCTHTYMHACSEASICIVTLHNYDQVRAADRQSFINM